MFIFFCRATLISVTKKTMNQGVTGNVALPGILRNGQSNVKLFFLVISYKLN